MDFEPIDRLHESLQDDWDFGEVLSRVRLEDRGDFVIVTATPTTVPEALVQAFDEAGASDPVAAAKRTIRRPGWRASVTATPTRAEGIRSGDVYYVAATTDGDAGWRRIISLKSTDGETQLDLGKPDPGYDPDFD